MENLERHQNNYPLFLRVMLGFGLLFLGSLGMLLLSMILSMFGFAYGMPDLIEATMVMEQIGILMLASSVVLGGGISFVGLAMRSVSPPQSSQVALEKAKNESRLFDIREHGLTVEDVLADMTVVERELLAEKLAESRLAIREDGVLVPVEQAEKLRNIERYIDE